MKKLTIGIAVLASASALAQANAIITGKVSGLIAGGDDANVSILLRDSQGKTQFVTLAPSWVLSQTRLNLRLKDKVAIEGAKSKVNGKETITAYTIKKGKVSVDLRDSAGAQRWPTASQTAAEITDPGFFQLTPSAGTSGYPGAPIVYPSYNGGYGNVIIFRSPVSAAYFPWRW